MSSFNSTTSTDQLSATIFGIFTQVLQVFPLAREYIHTVNILTFCKLFVHFKSYLLKFRRQYELLCCLLVKIRAFLRNWSILCRHFRRVPYGKWSPLALSLSHYHALFAIITSTKRCGTPNIGEEIVCFTEEENSHHRKAVISTSDDISKCNIASELSSGTRTVVKHCSRGAYSH